MYDFMEYCLRRYYRASGWNEDNQYSHLCATSRDFQAPHGLSLRLSKLPSTVFKTTTTMNALPVLEGSLGYLFTSRPLPIDDSASVRFRHLVDRFRIICLDHSIREADQWAEYDAKGKRQSDYLLCGSLNLANARLEALFSRRISKHRQFVISGISDPASRAASHLSTQLQYDKGKYCAEVSFSTDDGLIGVRGLYNFGRDFDESYQDMLREGRERRRRQGKELDEDKAIEEKFEKDLLQQKDKAAGPSPRAGFDRTDYLGEEPAEEWTMPSERIRGYWSVGAEVYYSATEKLGGVSTGLRYRTLPPLSPAVPTTDDSESEPTATSSKARYPTSTAPEHHQNYIPITITQTLNPIMGHVSSSYAAQVHPDLGLCSRFDFNLYSYDSELTAGVEWWIRERKGGSSDQPEGVASNSNKAAPELFPGVPDEMLKAKQVILDEEKQPIVGVIKARLGVHSGLALMWEGRFNKLLF
ncbi:Mitochondrial distribution and morphology protein 10, partial [Lunasporangiospora selenospora]